jgi:hypothetical protein
MNRAERIERLFELPIVVGALLVIPILIAEQTSPAEPWETLANVGNWLVWLLFLAEVVVMLAVVPEAAGYALTRSRSRSSSSLRPSGPIQPLRVDLFPVSTGRQVILVP